MRLPKRVFLKEQMKIMELKNTIMEIKVSLETLSVDTSTLHMLGLHMLGFQPPAYVGFQPRN